MSYVLTNLLFCGGTCKQPMDSSDFLPPHPVLNESQTNPKKKTQTNSIEKFVQKNRINQPPQRWASGQKKAFAQAAQRVFAV